MDQAFSRVGRALDEDARRRHIAAFTSIGSLPEYEEDERRVDTSLEANREIMLRRFGAVGFEPDVAEAMWQLNYEPIGWPLYPDAVSVVRAIRARGCKTALVSDYHADLRPHLREAGIEFDACVISFEHGFQKPDPRMFTTALDLLAVEPQEALMVGDRMSHDGAASTLGIDTLILPAPSGLEPRGLDIVLGMLG